MVDIQRLTRFLIGTKKEEEISSSGYVVHSLEAALWSFYHTKTFEEGVLKAINLGDDADTVGAITGQIAGAWYGYDAISPMLISGLAKSTNIIAIGEKLM
jgi:ADP-ribosyl-[dinitrogen reductase] hydrolase